MLQPTRKTITLSPALLVLLLLATLLIGLVSGGLLGGLAMSVFGARAALASEQTNQPGRAWVGITYIPITQAVANAYGLPLTGGVLIVAVTSNSPAAKSGLRENDIITRIDQRTLDETTSVFDAIKDKRPGDLLQMTVLRDGAEQSVEIVVGRSPSRPAGPQNPSLLDTLRRNLLRLIGRSE